MPKPRDLPPQLQQRPFAVTTAFAHGVTPGRLRARDLDHPFHGVAVPRTAERGIIEMCSAYLERMAEDECFSHQTAAQLHGVPLRQGYQPGDPLHVTAIGRAWSSRVRGIIGHYSSMRGLHAINVQGLPVADPVSTWIQLCGQELSDEDLVVAGDAYVGKMTNGLIRLGDLFNRVEGYRGRHVERARRILPLIRTGSESPFETLLRLAILGAGLPEPALNQTLTTPDGAFVARVDMLYRRQRVAIEYDGSYHHESRAQVAKDIERLERIRALGWDVVQVVASQLADGSAVSRIRSALERASAPRLEEARNVASSTNIRRFALPRSRR